MPKFGKASLKRLETLHPDLQELMSACIIDGPDFSIICGHRNKEDQETAVLNKKSKVHFPNSMHNHFPSLAVDVAPYPLNWKNTKRFYFLQGYIQGVANRLNIPIRLGIDWDRDYDFDDQKFIDMPHVELFNPKDKVNRNVQTTNLQLGPSGQFASG